MVLFINACVRKQSRTKRLADRLISLSGESFTEVRLSEIDFPEVDEEFLNLRQDLIDSESFGDPAFSLARQFAEADQIVIAAPFWDLSFPSSLKRYLEQITVSGVTFRYSHSGAPMGLCKAEKLYYVTTAGGFIPENNYGYNYVKRLCNDLYGIKNTVCIKAEGLDIDGADIDGIMRSAEEEIDSVFK